jgi:hypothetical protein
MKEKILQKIRSIVPNAYVIVEDRKAFYGGNLLKIAVAGSDKLISNVKGQHPGLVSLSLDLDKNELSVQIYGGCGGQTLLVNVNKNDPEQMYYAYYGVRIPFRKPQPNDEKILNAIGKFVQNWKDAIKSHLDRMPHGEMVDWKKIVE